MKRFVVEREFWDIFPEARINVLVVKGIDNHTPQEDEGYFVDLLKTGKEEVKKFLTEETFSQNSIIQEWPLSSYMSSQAYADPSKSQHLQF